MISREANEDQELHNEEAEARERKLRRAQGKASVSPVEKTETEDEAGAMRIAKFKHQNAEFRRLREQGQPSPLDEPAEKS